MLQNVVLGKMIQEKKFWGLLLSNLGDIQVAIWRFGLIFCGYFIWEYVVQKSLEIMVSGYIQQNNYCNKSDFC